MSPREWNSCQDPFRMLWYLRGEVPESGRVPPSSHCYEGDLYAGASPHATREQCVELARRTSLLWSVMTGLPADECTNQFGMTFGAMDDLFSTWKFLSIAACTVAHQVADASMVVTCADASEEDEWCWGWCGGPPDPLWKAVRDSFNPLQACLIRAIFTHPNIPTPTTGSCRPERYDPNPGSPV